MIKPIKNCNGYFISDTGEVFCNLGKGNRKNGKVVNMYQLKPRLTKTGYARVYMRDSITNKRKDYYIHRLVAEYFIPNPNNYRYVNHKDFVRHNNQVQNLEWCTAKHNTQITEDLGHLVRDKLGRYQSNFIYRITD